MIILAGGSGTRLWPASLQSRPKQHVVFFGESLLERALRRADALCGEGESPRNAPAVLVVAHKSQAKRTRALIANIKASTAARNCVVLAEPDVRNTAPAVAAALRFLGHKRAVSHDIILVMTADHLIEPLAAFRNDIERAARLARQGNIVVFGVPPTREETAYGYIEMKARGSEGKVGRFVEKPTEEHAAEFLRSGRHYWNAGMYLFAAESMREQLWIHEPRIAKIVDEVNWRPITHRNFARHLRAAYRHLPSISLDYAVAERSPRMAMVICSFHWNDVGSWDEVAEIVLKGPAGTKDAKDTAGPMDAAGAMGAAGDMDAAGDMGAANVVASVDAHRNYVQSDIPVALCGVHDLIVVARNGRLLICRRGKSQLVRKAANIMRKQEQ